MRLNRGAYLRLIFCAVFLYQGLVQAKPPAEGSFAPPRLRPCCALGSPVRVGLGKLETPVVLRNTVDFQQMGEHWYFQPPLAREQNGQLYTCKGGFIDISHVRSAADWTAYIYNQLANRSASEAVHIPMGPTRLVVKSHWLNGVRNKPEKMLAAAQHVAYWYAVWHEFITFHEIGETPLFNELFSAFSPEDLYSDALGVLIGARAIASKLPYDKAVAQELTSALSELGAGQVGLTQAAFTWADGQWWNSEISLPTREFLLKRNFSVGPELMPWTVPEGILATCSDMQREILHVEQPSFLAMQPEGWFGFEILQAEDQRRFGFDASWVLPSHISSRISEIESLEELRKKSVEPQPHNDWLLQRLRILPIRLVLEAAAPKLKQSEMGLLGGVEFQGVELESTAGSLRAFEFGWYASPKTEEVSLSFRGLHTNGLFACSEGSSWRAPLVALFHPCSEGSVGLSGNLVNYRFAPNTGDFAGRLGELNWVLNPLGNGFSSDYFRRNMRLFAGASVAHSHFKNTDNYLDSYVQAGLGLTLRSSQLGFELDVLSRFEQSLRYSDTRHFEGRLRPRFHWFRREQGGARSLKQRIDFGVELSYAYSTFPSRQVFAEVGRGVRRPRTPGHWFGGSFVFEISFDNWNL